MVFDKKTSTILISVLAFSVMYGVYGLEGDSITGGQSSKIPSLQQLVMCITFPCTYEAHIGERATISGYIKQNSHTAIIDTKIYIDQTIASLYLEMTVDGRDVKMFGKVSRRGPNSWGMPTLRPLSFTATVPGGAPSGALPVISIDDVVITTAFLTGLKESAFSACASFSPMSGGGDDNNCEGYEGGICKPLDDEKREKLACSGLKFTGGFSWIPFLPIVIPWGPNSPEVEACCVKHDIAATNSGCEQDRLDANAAFRKCVEANTGWNDYPLAQIVLAGVEGCDSGFKLNPKGCRCKLKIPSDYEAAYIQKMEHDAVTIKHSECCVDEECVKDKKCTAILTKKGVHVMTLFGECLNYGSGPSETGGEYRGLDGKPLEY